MQKLGEGAEPFVLKFAPEAPNSVEILGEDGDWPKMGVIYTVRLWIGEDTGDLEGNPNGSITMNILKVP